MEVLNEVGEMWDDLTDIDRSAISTALGGKQHVPQHIVICG